MNDIPKFDPKTMVNPALLALAKDVLNGVENGHIVGLGVVMQTADGQIRAPTMGQPLALYMGADLMKDDLKALLTGKARGNLLRPN